MSEPAKSCPTCARNPERMNSQLGECSHVECPNRRQVTAAPPNDQGDGPVPFRNPDNH